MRFLEPFVYRGKGGSRSLAWAFLSYCFSFLLASEQVFNVAATAQFVWVRFLFTFLLINPSVASKRLLCVFLHVCSRCFNHLFPFFLSLCTRSLAHQSYCIPRRTNRRTCSGSEAEDEEEDEESACRFMMMIIFYLRHTANPNHKNFCRRH